VRLCELLQIASCRSSRPSCAAAVGLYDSESWQYLFYVL